MKHVRILAAVAFASVLFVGPARAESLKLEGSWKSSLGPWRGGISMTVQVNGSSLSGTSQSTEGLCAGAHAITGTLKGGRWHLVTRPGGMCKEMRITLTSQGANWTGTYELIGPTPDKGTNTLTVVR